MLYLVLAILVEMFIWAIMCINHKIYKNNAQYITGYTLLGIPVSAVLAFAVKIIMCLI